MQQQIFDMLMKEDDISWQNILQELIRTQNLDPWDIDVSKLAGSYIETLKTMQQLNLTVSGKVILASAILLKIKSSRLVQEDLYHLERMMHNEPEQQETEEEEGFQSSSLLQEPSIPPYLLPRTPQPRQRKVSIYDLIEALQIAMEVRNRRAVREVLDSIPVNIPTKKEDISVIIARLMEKMDIFFEKTNNMPLKFNDLVPSKNREDMVMTFIPLLQLTNDRRIDMHQEEHFAEIQITKVLHSAGELLQMEEERLKHIKEDEPLKKRPARKQQKKPKDKSQKEEDDVSDNAHSKTADTSTKQDAIDISTLEEARDLINKTLDEVAQLPEKESHNADNMNTDNVNVESHDDKREPF